MRWCASWTHASRACVRPRPVRSGIWRTPTRTAGARSRRRAPSPRCWTWHRVTAQRRPRPLRARCGTSPPTPVTRRPSRRRVASPSWWRSSRSAATQARRWPPQARSATCCSAATATPTCWRPAARLRWWRCWSVARLAAGLPSRARCLCWLARRPAAARSWLRERASRLPSRSPTATTWLPGRSRPSPPSTTPTPRSSTPAGCRRCSPHCAIPPPRLSASRRPCGPSSRSRTRL
mmetsp:Transcript_23032/g.58088  ORF Transcript_23032/g.58088 Transcript_23032/m.58088 type:complete len:235 (+) Transcript_23032:312-1016(+)